MRRHVALPSLLIVISIVLAACATPTAPAAPPPVQQTVVVTSVVTAAPTAAPAMPTPVASVDPSALAQKGKLLICSDLPYPPFEILRRERQSGWTRH